MSGGNDWLSALAQQMRADIENGAAPNPETLPIRELLAKFGYSRRGGWIVEHIKRNLRRLDLITIPEFDSGPIDSTIAITLSSHVDHPEPDDTVLTDMGEMVRIDPTLRIRDLESVINKPIDVNVNAELKEATTIMIRHDYSQLPVMAGERNVKGVISWQSIGSRLALNVASQKVRDFMETERLNEKIIPSDRPLLEAINLVIEHGYILVRGNDQTLTGIVTATDLSDQFRQLSQPFLLIGEIEGHLRNLIGANFAVSAIKDALAGNGTVDDITSPEDLSFGQYWYLLEQEERWSKVGLNVDRVQFINLLKSVNAVRNDVMHFRPKGLSDEDITTLNEAARFLQRLAQIGTI